MKELHKLDNYDFDTLESFINNSIEESPYIEFKSGEALSKKDSHKKEISKDVSAFANSNGGIIIYGISEKNHKANNFSFIDGNVFNKEWLEQIITSTIHRNIPDLKIFQIRRNGNVEETLYVVQIPSSFEAPHMCREKRFYRRGLFESIIMEEYEVRQLYWRKVKSKLILNGYSILPQKAEDMNNYKFLCETGVMNEGDIPEKDYKINVYFEGINSDFKSSWRTDGASRDYDYTRLAKNRIKISASSTATVYPKESINVLRFNFELSRKSILENLNNMKIEFKLLYLNGNDSIKIDLKGFTDKLDKLNELFD